MGKGVTHQPAKGTRKEQQHGPDCPDPGKGRMVDWYLRERNSLLKLLNNLKAALNKARTGMLGSLCGYVSFWLPGHLHSKFPDFMEKGAEWIPVTLNSVGNQPFSFGQRMVPLVTYCINGFHWGDPVTPSWWFGLTPWFFVEDRWEGGREYQTTMLQTTNTRGTLIETCVS